MATVGVKGLPVIIGRMDGRMCRFSEQKRRFQQQYPNSPSDVIDDAMRRHWESLGDRDRNRYVQRARSAMAVERGRRRVTQQLTARGHKNSIFSRPY